MAYDLWQARGRAAVIAVERFVSAGSSNRHETIWHEAFRRLTRRLRRGSGLRPSLQISPLVPRAPSILKRLVVSSASM